MKNGQTALRYNTNCRLTSFPEYYNPCQCSRYATLSIENIIVTKAEPFVWAKAPKNSAHFMRSADSHTLVQRQFHVTFSFKHLASRMTNILPLLFSYSFTHYNPI